MFLHNNMSNVLLQDSLQGEDLLLSITASRSFTPDLYTSNSGYSSSSLPWYADLMHLVFWFFYLTVFTICLWLSYSFIVCTRCVETRFPIRETRGFSRAQTGDTLTAVIPMCWSITMLMHASVHSSNFDENTDSSSLLFSIIAYQWGWDYSFDLDSSLLKDHITSGLDFELESKKQIVMPNNQRPDIVKLSFNSDNINESNITNFEELLKVTEKTSNFTSCSTFFNTKFSLINSLSQATQEFDIPINPSFLQKPHQKHLIAHIDCDVDSITNASPICLNSVWNNLTLLNNNIDQVFLSGFELAFSFNSKFFSSVLKDSILNIPKIGDEFDNVFFTNFKTNVLTSTRQTVNINSDFLLSGGLVHRLRITSAILLPSDYPLHLVCGSKDVIHSWAIPGLGIKIDCIPGYNCHRRLMLRWRGLFWGQCMEVCGRYHHWMPILLKVTNVDFFILWLKSFL